MIYYHIDTNMGYNTIRDIYEYINLKFLRKESSAGMICLKIEIGAIQKRLRFQGRTDAGNFFFTAAFFAGDTDAVSRGFHKIIALTVLASAMNAIFFG